MAYFLAFGLLCFHVSLILIKTGENWKITNGRGARPDLKLKAILNPSVKLYKILLWLLFFGLQSILKLLLIIMGTRRKTTTSQHYPKIQSSNLKGENTLMTCIAFNCVSNSNFLVLNDPDVDEDVKEKKYIYM